MRKFVLPFCPQPFVWPYPVRLHAQSEHQSTLSAGYLHAHTICPAVMI